MSDGLLVVVDLIVGAASVYLDDSNPRPLSERLTEWVETILEPNNQNQADEIAAAMKYVADSPEGWINKLRAHLSKPAILRLVGAANYKELTDATKQDTAVVIRALQRLAIQFRPMALALEDAITLVPEAELASAGLGAFPVKILQALFDLEEQATTTFLPRLGIQIDAAFRPSDDDMNEVMEELRVLVADDSLEQVRRIGNLQHKISGARHALDGSDDGVSQAANSLIELIDRSFREAYPKNVVLKWVEDVFPDSIETYTHKDDQSGELCPNKFAEALCFTAGGSTSGDAGKGISRLVALALYAARKKLQKFKHNDDSTEEQREQVRLIMRGVEGAMVVGIRLGFGMAQMFTNLNEASSKEALDQATLAASS